MNQTPPSIDAIQRETNALGFTMASEPATGAVLAVLAATKPGGRFLELGTGTGLGTAWLLSGMDANSRLDSVDSDATVVAVARHHLGGDSRVTFHVRDGADFLRDAPRGAWDFIYADAWPGKFTLLQEALSLLRAGGIYFIDDLRPQPNWPEGHGLKVAALIEALGRSGLAIASLDCASGLMLAVQASLEPRPSRS
jgi:predicted O-methyltransferase YrrM